MDYAMLEAQKISNRIGTAYSAALRDIQSQLGSIFKNFANGISEAEAKRILQRASLDPDADYMDSLRQAISLVEDPDEKAALLAELNAPAYKARMQRLKALAEDVGKKCDELARTADSALDGGLRRIVRDSYYRGVFDMQQRTGIAFSFSKVSERMIKEVLQQNWSGEHYSERIWHNTDELAEQLQDVLMKGVLTGASSGRMANEIQERFHASYSRALTLTRTESSHCANSAELERYKDTGVDKYRYVATLDNRTSEICQELDGKEFPVKDAKPGTNYPPMHPRCRSTTIEALSPELMKKLERRARDPETGKLMTVPGNMTYREWYGKYVDQDVQIIDVGNMDYMSNSIRLKYDKDIKDITIGSLSIPTHKVTNSEFNLFVETSEKFKSPAARLTEKNLRAVKTMLPKDIDIPDVVVVDFEKYGLNKTTDAYGNIIEQDVIAGHDPKTGILLFNSKYNSQRKILEYVTRIPKQFANQTVYAPYLHELGHNYYEKIVKALANSKKIEYNKAKDVIDGRIYDYLHLDGEIRVSDISDYANDGYIKHKYSEIIAESFSAYATNDYARDMVDYVTEGELL